MLKLCNLLILFSVFYLQKVALENGLILVDTKYEFGKTSDGTIVLIDEVIFLTWFCKLNLCAHYWLYPVTSGRICMFSFSQQWQCILWNHIVLTSCYMYKYKQNCYIINWSLHVVENFLFREVSNFFYNYVEYNGMITSEILKCWMVSFIKFMVSSFCQAGSYSWLQQILDC